MVGKKWAFLQHFWSVDEVVHVTYNCNVVLGMIVVISVISVVLDSY